MLIEDAVRRLAAAGVGGAVGEVLADHPDRAVFRLGTAYVKADTDLVRHRRELAALRAAGAAGVRVSAVLHAEDGLLVLAELPGRPLARIPYGRERPVGPPTDRPTDEQWRAAGRALRTLHEAPAPDVPRYGPKPELSRREAYAWWTEYEAAKASPEVARWLRGPVRKALQDVPGPTGLVHGDCQTFHLLVEGDEVGFVDLGDAGRGDPMWDVAVLTLFHPEGTAPLLAAYGAPESPLIAAYQGLRLAGAAGWLVEHGYDAGRELGMLAERAAMG